MTYEERVDKATKKLYAAATGYAPFQGATGNAYWRFAGREAVDMQAQAIREVFEYIFGDRSDIDPDIFLKQNGYIPEKEEE